MELHDAVIYGFPYKLRPKPKIASFCILQAIKNRSRGRPGNEAIIWGVAAPF